MLDSLVRIEVLPEDARGVSPLEALEKADTMTLLSYTMLYNQLHLCFSSPFLFLPNLDLPPREQGFLKSYEDLSARFQSVARKLGPGALFPFTQYSLRYGNPPSNFLSRFRKRTFLSLYAPGDRVMERIAPFVLFGAKRGFFRGYDDGKIHIVKPPNGELYR